MHPDIKSLHQNNPSNYNEIFFEAAKSVVLYVCGRSRKFTTPSFQTITNILYLCDFNHYQKYEQFFVGGRYKRVKEGVFLLGLGGILSRMASAGYIQVIASEGKQTVYKMNSVDECGPFTAKEFGVMHSLIFLLETFESAEVLNDFVKDDHPPKNTRFTTIIDYSNAFYRDPPHSVVAIYEYEDEDTENGLEDEDSGL